jgi:hypothetical protein
MYVGGPREGDLGNREFLARHVKAHGALGDLLVRKKAKQLIAEHNLSEPQENGDLWTAVATVCNDLAKIATLDGD